MRDTRRVPTYFFLSTPAKVEGARPRWPAQRATYARLGTVKCSDVAGADGGGT